MKKFSFYLRKEFEQSPLLAKVNRPKQKAGYIGSILNNVLKPLGCDVLIEDIEKAINYTQTVNHVFEALDVIKSFLKKLFWINKNFPSNTKIQGLFTEKIPSINSLNAWSSVLGDYKDFLKDCINKGDIIPKTSPRYAVTQTGWNVAKKKLKEIEIEILSMKGTDSLLWRFGGLKFFLQEVLRNSYFFDKKLVKERFDEIASDLYTGKLYARESKDTKIQSNGFFHFNSEIDGSAISIPFIEDTDGNKQVRELIKDITGYTVSEGYDSIFLFYIISHVWGDASDPRNFTNFWNIAIVPAWANFILDKRGVDDDSAQKMINTFKAICVEYYKMKATIYNLTPYPAVLAFSINS